MDFTHRFVPAPAIRPARVLLLLHGTGGDENDMLPLGRELDPEAALLSPRGKVLENGMPRFFRRLAEAVFDEADVVRRANELADFVGAAAARYEFDLRRVIAVGYSNGANIAAAVLLLRPEVLASAILLRTMVPLVPPQPPDLAHARVLISSGARDPIVPVENAKRLAAMLREAGANVTLHFEAAGHALAPGDLAAAKEWLRDGEPSALATSPA
jgi:phospholipase/carboxylesterase